MCFEEFRTNQGRRGSTCMTDHVQTQLHPSDRVLTRQGKQSSPMHRHLSAAVILAALAYPLQAQDQAPKMRSQTRSPRTPSAKPRIPASPKSAPLTPLIQQEKALQLLTRFTFGPRPGDVEKVLAQTPEKWFEQQLNPAGVNDDA